jgi:hypothetical protein
MRRAIRTSHDLQPPGYRCRSLTMTNDTSAEPLLPYPAGTEEATSIACPVKDRIFPEHCETD